MLSTHRDAPKEETVTIATLSDVDVRVGDAVMRQLDWDSEVDASAVGVAAKNGERIARAVVT
jgi:hypothetical protein